MTILTLREKNTKARTRQLVNIDDKVRIWNPVTDTEVMTIETHGVRHIEGREDPIMGLTYAQLAPDTIIIRIPVLSLAAQSGLAADSTGVKAQSVKTLFYSRHVKKIRLLSEITSIPSDATVRIGVYNLTAGAYVMYRDYAGATGKYIDEYTGTMPADDAELVIRIEVTTASATAGATFNTGDCLAQTEVGIS